MDSVLTVKDADAITYPVVDAQAYVAEAKTVLVLDPNDPAVVFTGDDNGVVTIPVPSTHVVSNSNDVLGAVSVTNIAALTFETTVTQVISTLAQAPAPSYYGRVTWIDLVANWSDIPMFVVSLTGGDVWEYTYTGGDVLYRFIGSEPYSDAFYRTFDGSTLSDLVLARGMTL